MSRLAANLAKIGSALACLTLAGCLERAPSAPQAAAPAPPGAGPNPSGASCAQLWHARNAIYAEYGFCFKTPQAIKAFGHGCFPPYGQLPPRAKARADEYLAQEHRKGCRGS